nr:MAG TPA: hypothetical protein [Caudoviricetes sp.]
MRLVFGCCVKRYCDTIKFGCGADERAISLVLKNFFWQFRAFGVWRWVWKMWIT